MSKNNYINAVPYYLGGSDQVRYKIVDTITGRTLDNGRHNGGYETASQAYTSWSYKKWNKKKQRQTKYQQEEIRLWMTKHDAFCRRLANYNVDIWRRSHHRRSLPFDDELEEMLLEEDPNFNFPISEFKKIWQSNT